MINIEIIENWLKTLTAEDFKIATAPLISGYNTIENIKKADLLAIKKKLKRIDSDSNDLKIGDYFLLDSIYEHNYLCLCQKIRGKKHHKVIKKLAKKSHFNNFSWGFFEIPKEIIKNF